MWSAPWEGAGSCPLELRLSSSLLFSHPRPAAGLQTLSPAGEHRPQDILPETVPPSRGEGPGTVTLPPSFHSPLSTRLGAAGGGRAWRLSLSCSLSCRPAEATAPAEQLGGPGAVQPLLQCAAWLDAYFREPAVLEGLPVPALHHPIFQKGWYRSRQAASGSGTPT